MRLDLLREQLDLQEQTNHTEAQRTAAQLQAQITEANAAASTKAPTVTVIGGQGAAQPSDRR
jgi:hypothetical protein